MASVHLSVADRNAPLGLYRSDPDPQVRHRAHLLLLLGDGYPWVTIAAVPYTSPTMIARGKRRFVQGGVDAVSGRGPGRPRSWVHTRASPVVRWVLTRSPAEFRFARSRWSCEAVAVVLREDDRVRVGRETVRLWLRAAGLVWRRPRPVTRPRDPDRDRKLRALRALPEGLPADETAVFMDEVDVNLNPKVGCQWVRRGQQGVVETPGTNVKRYLAGRIHWRTGRLILTEGRPREGRSAAPFLRHLDDLRRAFRHYRVVHVICDNARTHKPGKGTAVRKHLAAWAGRVVVHYLPTYAPDCNPVERAWRRRHEAVTRNHRCHTMDELLDLTSDWFATRTHGRVETRIYGTSPKK
jgi:transposase